MRDVDPLHTPEDLAARYGVSRRFVIARAGANTWPHIKVGRRVRFSDEHIAEIDRMQTVSPTPAQPVEQAASWGRRTRSA